MPTTTPPVTPPASPGPTPTVTVTMTTAAAPSSTSGPDPLIAALLSGAVIAAAVGAAVNTYLARRRHREEERGRVRTICAEALEAVAAYKEFPYAIRRRRADEPAAERIRLSDEMRHVQVRLTYYSSWMKGESTTLAAAYDELLTNVRRTAGAACHDAWLAAPATSDDQMNFEPGVVDLSSIAPYEEAYVAAVRDHLKHVLKVWRRD